MIRSADVRGIRVQLTGLGTGAISKARRLDCPLVGFEGRMLRVMVTWIRSFCDFRRCF